MPEEFKKKLLDEITDAIPNDTPKEEEKKEETQEVDDYNGVDTVAEYEMLKDKEKQKYGLL